MSTTPTVPTAAPAVIPGELSKVNTYIKAHEKLIVIVLCLAVGVYGYQKAADLIERHDQRVSDTAHATLQAQVDKTNAIATVNQQAAAQYQQLATELAQSNAALAAAIAARNTATVKQQATDRTLPPSDLASRWTNLIHVTADNVQPTPAGDFTVKQGAAVETVVALDSIPALKADLTDETTIATNKQNQLDSATSLNFGLNKQIDGLNIELNDETKACTADKNLLKAQARKSKLKWFAAGFVTGIATRIWFKF